MDLSIVIVSYNTCELLAACLDSILEQADGLSWEVIVVDNASSDGTVAMLGERFPTVRLIANQENRGFPAANNQGFAVSRGRYILMLNPDTLIHAGALEELVCVADTLPKVGVFGAQVRNGEGTFDLTCHPFPTVANVLYAHFQLHRLLPGILDQRYLRQCQTADRPVQVDWVQGCCLMFRRKVREATGDLDPQFFLFAEEVDFCYRARQAAYPTYYIPTATITHYGSGSTNRNLALKISSHHLGKLRFFRKHKGALALLILRISFLGELGVKVILRLTEMLVRPRATTRVYLKAYWQTIGECLTF